MAEGHVQFEKFTTEYFDSVMDPDGVSKDWTLFTSPYPVMSISTIYLLFILFIGPRFMNDRQPYELTNIMRLYNVVQISLNGFLFYLAVSNETCLFQTFCNLEQSLAPCRYLSPTFLLAYWTFLSVKILDLCDTVFMVLRKKYSHITFLHVYHHSGMVLATWYCARYYKTPQAPVLGFINAFVHMVMYSYYFLATFSSLKKYLWWKKHLTKLQLGQFVVMLAYLSSLYYYDCEVTPIFFNIWVINITVIGSFFVNFYVKTYLSI